MKLTHRRAFSSGTVASGCGSRTPAAPASIHAQHPARCPQLAPSNCGATTIRLHLTAPTRLRVNAGSSASSSPSTSQPVVVELPASQQDAVEAAVQCLLPVLQPLISAAKPAKTAKGFSGSRRPSSVSNRFGIEIPVADSSPQAVYDLTSLLVNTTTARLKQQRAGGGGGAAVGPAAWTVVHAREDVVQHARSRGGGGGGGGGSPQVLGLRQACQQPQLAGLLVVVEPAVSDVALVEQLLDEVWSGPAVLMLNPEWGQQGAAVAVPEEYGRLVEGVTVLYSFLPCAIQGLLGRKEGAVLRAVQPGLPPAQTAWRVLLRQKDQFIQVGALGRRPTSSDLEMAFINASAAASPLTQTAKFIRALIPGGDGKKK